MAKVCSTLLFLSAIFMLISQAISQPPNFLYQFCLDKGNYTSNSTYNANLNHLLSSLPSLSSNTEIDNGFYNVSYGQNPDKVYALGLCRADAKHEVCRSCLSNATNLLTLLCPNQKEAIGWYDYCMLRYSFRNIFGIKEDSPSFYMWNRNNVSANVDEFNQDLRTLFDSLRSRASTGGSLRKFAAGNATAPNFQTLYALMQCTPDLSEQDCSDCLGGVMGGIPNCCNGKQGGRVVGPSCNLRYEVYLFYDPTADPTPPSPSPPPSLPVSPSPPSTTTPTTKGNGSNKSLTVVYIVVPVVAFVVVIISICVYLRVRKPRKKPESKAVDEIISEESLQLDFDTVRVATDDFSDANKLGQGGFGAVYKGKLSDGQVIAVKRLSKDSGQGDQEFKNEVLLVAKLQHRNLVRLLGFCLERNERLLIYEFMTNTSLDCFIFGMVAL
uniref:Cysteine-rich receptor-like protein kinase 25 n=1 Tax=Fagus sylvatica TaxID=28930 RepID=A0A2N9GGM7_FAGSY